MSVAKVLASFKSSPWANEQPKRHLPAIHQQIQLCCRCLQHNRMSVAHLQDGPVTREARSCGHHAISTTRRTRFSHAHAQFFYTFQLAPENCIRSSIRTSAKSCTLGHRVQRGPHEWCRSVISLQTDAPVAKKKKKNLTYISTRPR